MGSSSILGPDALKSSDPYTIKAFRDLSLRIYPDTSPHNLEISGLHKGLILLWNGRELLEEGAGFGVPVVRYSDKTYFSGTADVFAHGANGRAIIVKSFVVDTVSMKKIGGGPFINDSFYHLLHRAFTRGYLSLKGLRPVFDKAMALRSAAGVRTEFLKAKPRGRINVVYTCSSDVIGIGVDLRELDPAGCEEVVVLNEQGASFFSRYSDASGQVLEGRKIGAWDRIEAERASLSDPRDRLSFGLSRSPDAAYYRGWERVEGRLSWAGINYSLKSIPSAFKYEIKLRCDRSLN